MSVYRVIDIIGTSTESWEEAARSAATTASGTVRDLRVARVVDQDLDLAEDGGVTFRIKLELSFKYEES
jgi:dodecin